MHQIWMSSLKFRFQGMLIYTAQVIQEVINTKKDANQERQT